MASARGFLGLPGNRCTSGMECSAGRGFFGGIESLELELVVESCAVGLISARISDLMVDTLVKHRLLGISRRF